MNKYTLYKMLYRFKLGNFRKLFLKEPYCIILAYHRVSLSNSSNPFLKDMIVAHDVFERQMQYIKENYKVISIDEIDNYFSESKNHNKNAAVVTFDDGYEDNYKYAFPILKRYSIPAIIYVPTLFINGVASLWWDDLACLFEKTKKKKIRMVYKKEWYNFSLKSDACKKKTFYHLSNILKYSNKHEIDDLLNYLSNLLEVHNADKPSYFLSWKQIEEMSKYNILFGAHTHSHSNVVLLDKKKLNEEIIKPKQIIEQHINKKVKWFSYPYGEKGDFNKESIDVLRKAGYTNSVTMLQGFVNKKDDLFMMRRIGIGGNDSDEIFQLKLSGLIPIVKGKY